MAKLTVKNESGAVLEAPSWDDSDHLRDLASDPVAAQLRDEALPTLAAVLEDTVRNVLPQLMPEQKRKLLAENPKWHVALRQAADLVAAATSLSDDEIADAVMNAADAEYTEQTEPTRGGKTRVVERRWESQSVGHAVVERPRYLHPADSDAWGAQGGIDRQVVKLDG